MKKILCVGLVLFNLSCSKNDKQTCYECDKANNGNYTSEGCFSSDDWKNHVVVDNLGNAVNKDQRCRKK